MLMLVCFLCFSTLISIILIILYFRQSEGNKLERMALKNLLTDEEKSYYIDEYKKILTAKLVFEHMSEHKDDIEIVREVIKAERVK